MEYQSNGLGYPVQILYNATLVSLREVDVLAQQQHLCYLYHIFKIRLLKPQDLGK